MKRFIFLLLCFLFTRTTMAQSPFVPGYPTQLPSASNLGNGANNAKSTLNGTITSGATTLVVASAATFPAAPFTLTCQSEIMIVTAKSGTSFTVTRGAFGTTAASHSTGAAVNLNVVWGYHSVLESEVINIATLLGTNASQTHPSSASIFIGTSSSASKWATPSGDLTMDNTGAFTIPNKLLANTPRTTIVGTTAATMNNPRDVLVFNKIAVVTNFGANQINLYDVSIPATPTLISTISDVDLNAPRQTAYDGKYLYVTNQSGNSYTVFDVTNPKAPSKLVTKSGGSIASPGGIYVRGNRLYLTGTQTGAQFTIFDNTNPAVPVELGSYTPPSGEKVGRCSFQSKYAYCPMQSSGPFTDDGYYVIDISNSASPSLAGRLLVNGVGTTGAPVDSSIIGNILYGLDEGGGMRVIDVTDPTTPAQLGYTTTGISGGSTGLWAQGRYVYVGAQANNTVVAFDVIDPTNPTVVSTSAATLSVPSKLTVAGRYLYVVNRGSGTMSIVDLGQDDVAQIKAGALQADHLSISQSARIGYGTVDGDFIVGRTMKIGDSLSVNGDLAINGNVTNGLWNATVIGTQYGGLGANNSASSGVPLFASGVVTMTSTNGTGNFVRATSPTITTPSIAKLSNLTTSGILYTSGGDGTLNAAANVTTDGSSLNVTNNANAGYSIFGQQASVGTPVTGSDNLYSGMVSNTTSGGRTAFVSIAEFTGTSNSTAVFTGLNATAQSSGTASGNMTASIVPGGLFNRFQVNHVGSGTITLASAISARVRSTGGNAGTITDSSDFNAETPTVNTGTTWNSFAGLWVRGGSPAGAITTRYGVRVDTLTGGSTVWGLWLQTDNAFIGGTITAGSGNTVLTDSTGKVLSAALNTVGVAQGGTGQVSFTDGQLLIGNTATGLLSKATLTQGANVTITNGSGTITIAAATPPTAANPTATVGTSAVNGSASTFMRSDGAPAIDQTMSPTWTGIHTFTPGARSSGVASYLTVNIPADTGQTASTESIGYRHVTGTRTWAAGTIAEQRENVFEAPTYAFASASTITRAVDGYFATPKVGTNATLATSVALLLEASAAAHVPLMIRAAGSQSGDLTRWVDSTSAVLSKVNSSGMFIAANGTTNTVSYGFTSGSTAYGLGFNSSVSVPTIVTNGTDRIGFGISTAMFIASRLPICWNSGALSSTCETSVSSRAAATLLLGAADAASPVAQSLTVQDVVGGTADTAGAAFKIIGSLGTSQGKPGTINLQGGALITASGTTQQTAVDRLIIGATKVLANNTGTAIVNVTDASNTVAAGIVDYSVEVFNGTDLQVESGSFTYQVVNKGGVFSLNTITFPTGYPKNATTSGTLTCTWTITGANPAVLTLNANSSLTPSTGYPRLTYTISNLTQQAIATQ